jgi:hypothetical protein
MAKYVCHAYLVPSGKIDIPEVLPVSPVSLPCPKCKAKAGKDCATTSGGFAAIHLERVKAAALADRKNSLKRRQAQRKR